MDDFQFFENTQNLFKNRENFQRAYNTLKEVIKSNIDSSQKLLNFHHNTYLRLLKSFYHLEKLKQLRACSGKSVSALQLIFIHYEELVASLHSSLDALAYEINEIYQLNLGKYIDIRKIMDELPESPLGDFLQREIQPKSRNHWYCIFTQQRNIAIHRPTMLLEAKIQREIDLEREEIKEDIVIKRTKIFKDSHEYYDLIERLIINACKRLKDKIAGRKVLLKEDIKGELFWMIECPYCGTLVAWREKRNPDNWPTKEEKEEYDLINTVLKEK